MLSPRKQAILKAVIEEYTRSAEPVGSELLFEKYHFNVSPATIRAELLELTEEGYLAQPHTSAGRVPTDKGYRFYVNALMQERAALEEGEPRPKFGRDLKTPEKETLERELLRDEVEMDALLRHAVQLAARMSRSLAVGGLLHRPQWFEAGLAELLSQPEFFEHETAFQVARMFDELDRHLERLTAVLENGEPKVFIGRENPFGVRDVSLLVSGYRLGGELPGFLALIGPTRMEYARNLSLMEYMTRLLNRL